MDMSCWGSGPIRRKATTWLRRLRKTHLISMWWGDSRSLKTSREASSACSFVTGISFWLICTRKYTPSARKMRSKSGWRTCMLKMSQPGKNSMTSTTQRRIERREARCPTTKEEKRRTSSSKREEYSSQICSSRRNKRKSRSMRSNLRNLPWGTMQTVYQSFTPVCRDPSCLPCRWLIRLFEYGTMWQILVNSSRNQKIKVLFLVHYIQAAIVSLLVSVIV